MGNLKFLSGSSTTLPDSKDADSLYFCTEGKLYKGDTLIAEKNNTAVATTSANGLMSSTDKSKLDGIASGANKYTLPIASSTVLGGVCIGSNITQSSNGQISITKTNVTNALGYTPLQSHQSLSDRAVNQSLSSEDLNNVTTPGFYNAPGSNGVTNKPTGVSAFGLIVTHDASGAYYTQILFDGEVSDKSYIRHCNNSTWTSWSEMKFTDTTYDLSSFATETWVNNKGYTTNKGTVTSVAVKMNGATKGTITSSGTIDLGTVLTSHQSISGKADLSGSTFTGNVTLNAGKALQLNTIKAPTASSGSTYGPGTNGQVLKSNGSTVYWASDSNNDTKNTAGSTNTSSKIFLIGATSQSANPVTYSHDTAYVGTDGCLYSNGAKVLTSHQSLAGKSDTSHTHKVKINGVEKTIAASSGTAVDLGTYLTGITSSNVTNALGYTPLSGTPLAVGSDTMKLYASSNEVNFGGSSTNTNIYFGYSKRDNRPLPTSYIFGGSNNTYATLLASSYKKYGGTSKQFLKADGSVDSNTYLTSSSLASNVVPMIVGSATGWNSNDGMLTFEIIAKQGISNMNNIPAGTVFMIHNTVANCSNLSYLEDDESGYDFYFINPVTVSMNGGIIAYSYIGGDGDLFVFSAT